MSLECFCCGSPVIVLIIVDRGPLCFLCTYAYTGEVILP